MSMLVWNNNMSVKIAEIDKQHKKLVEMINSLSDAMKSGIGKDVIGKIINDLADYAEYHFETEEKYFAKYNYPQAEEHIKEHTDFVKKVLDFKTQFDSGRLSLSVQVINFLSTWLRGHIMGVDKQYSAFLNEKGLR